ncbi:MAG: hypothetical protein WDW36_007730 [Sanguina aurantia]
MYEAVKEQEKESKPVFDDGMNDYERERALQIQRNRDRMSELQLPEAMAVVGALNQQQQQQRGAGPTQRGVSSRKVKSETPTPSARVSLRCRGIEADKELSKGVDMELAGGAVILVAGAGARLKRELADAADAAAAAAKARRTAPCPAVSGDGGNGGSDAALLERLTTLSALAHGSARGFGCGPGGGGGGGRSKQGGRTCETLDGLRLVSRDVAKVTKDGTTHLVFHPSPDELILAAADKQGYVSIWRPDEAESGASKGAGVSMFKPHGQYASGLCWAGGLAGGGARLFSASYEGTVRMLDPAAAMFLSLQGIPTGTEISAMEVSPDGNLVYIGDGSGDLNILDVRAGAAVRPTMDVHNKKVNSLHLEPTHGLLLASGSSDGCVCVWDVRTMTTGSGGGKPKPLATIGHSKSCHGAFWAPDGSQRIMTTSFDDSVKIWADPKSSATTPFNPSRLAQALSVKHNNQTGRWIIPLKAVWATSSLAPPAAAATASSEPSSRGKRSASGVGAAGAAGGGGGVDAALPDPQRVSDHVQQDPGVIMIGSMSGHAVDRISVRDGAAAGRFTDELVTAICARVVAHPTLPAVATASGSGRVFVWRG